MGDFSRMPEADLVDAEVLGGANWRLQRRRGRGWTSVADLAVLEPPTAARRPLLEEGRATIPAANARKTPSSTEGDEGENVRRLLVVRNARSQRSRPRTRCRGTHRQDRYGGRRWWSSLDPSRGLATWCSLSARRAIGDAAAAARERGHGRRRGQPLMRGGWTWRGGRAGGVSKWLMAWLIRSSTSPSAVREITRLASWSNLADGPRVARPSLRLACVALDRAVFESVERSGLGGLYREANSLSNGVDRRARSAGQARPPAKFYPLAPSTSASPRSTRCSR